MFKVPEDLAVALKLYDRDPAAAAPEAMALSVFRDRLISAFQLRVLLGIQPRFELDAGFKEHRLESYTFEDFEHDLQTLGIPMTSLSSPANPKRNVSVTTPATGRNRRRK